MSTYTHNYRPQGNFPNRGSGPRRNDNRQYRSHPSAQHSQLGTPPIIQHMPPRAQPVGVPGRVLLTNIPTPNQPLLMQPTLTGPNARAPTVFPQNLSVVPQAIPQQLIGQNPPGAGLPPVFIPQQQYATTNQPINLGNPAAQLGATNAPQQIPGPGGIHTLPHMMTSVNTAMGTMNQVAPTGTTTYRGMPMQQTSRPPSTQSKRQSKAIKIIDPDTKKEVSMGGSKPETPQQPPPLMQPDVPTPATLPSIGAPMTSGATPPLNAPPTGHVITGGGGGSVAQDFKRMVHERNTTGAVNAQGGPVTIAAPTTAVVQKPPPPNAIITDPNNKAGVGGGVGGVSNKIGVSEPVPSSKTRFDVHIETSTQQPRSLLGSQPSTSATAQVPTVSEADQKKRDEFRQKILQSVNQTTSTTAAVEEGKAAQQEVHVEVKNGGQEASMASQNIGENQKEGLLPLPLPTPPPPPQATGAPLNASPDEPSVKPVEENEKEAPSEDKIATIPSIPDTETTANNSGGEQVEAPTSDAVHVQTNIQPAPVESIQPEKMESDETIGKEVEEDVSPPPGPSQVPVPPPSTEEATLPVPPEKIEVVPEKGAEEESTESIQVEDTGSQVIIDSEAPPPAATATPVVADEPREVESEAVTVQEEDSGREEKLQEDKEEQLDQVESSQPPVAQEIPEAEPPKPEEEVKKEEEEEKPTTSTSEPEQDEKEETVKKPEAAVPSSAVLVSESPVTARKVKEETPSATVKELPSDVEKPERTEMPAAPDSSVKTEAKMEESKPAIVADQKETSISKGDEAKEKEVSSEPKEPSPPKKIQEDERRSDAVPVPTKPVKQEKPVGEGKSSASPPTKPKEVVKTIEQSVKPEKQDRPASSKAVPASAQLAPASSEPPSASQPSQNPLGRTMYQREFLLQFKDRCKEVPPELESTDVYKLNAYQDHKIAPNPAMGRDYMREYSRDRDRDRDRDSYRKGGRSRADSRRGGGYQQAPVSKEPVDLHKAEHRWVRPKRADGETDELFRKFQGILNKLTPQKFQNLAEQALQLKIDDEERLKGCIDKIFTKALEEPKFSIAYANLCKVMSTIKVEVPTEPEGKTKVITFRRVLLTKCQQEFEKDKRDDEERENMLNAIKETEDAEKKKQLQGDLEAFETKNRKRSLGNIRFIGELFKLKMLSETIMHECVVRLLRSSSDEESLECFAGLITTTGKDLDKPEAKTRIDQYFTRITEIIKKGKVPARIKFMLQDVQELRGNNWVPRVRQEQSLKTIDQIHHEAKVEEEKEKQFVAQAFAGGMKHGGGSRRGSAKPDDWPGGGKGDRDRDRRDKDRDRDRERDRDRDRDKPKEKLDARKLQVLLKHREKKDLGAPTLGPGSGLRPQVWGRGGAGASNAAQDSTKTDKDKRPSRTSSSGNKRSDKDKLPISGRGSGSGAKRAHSTPTPDSQSEKALAIEAVHQAMTRQPQSSSQSKREQHHSQQQPKGRGEHRAPQPAQDKMDESTVRRKTTTIVDELVQNKDFKEAIECVREMKSPGKMNFLVSEAINHSLEKSSQHREFSGKLFNKLVQGRHVSEAKFMEGLNEVLEFAEDIAIDIPKIWDYLGEILSHVISQSTLSLSFLGSTYPSLLSSGKAGLLAAKILVHCRSQLSSDDDVASLWSGASLEWSALGVAEDDVGEFLSRHSLTYLKGSSQPSLGSQPLKYVTELTHQFRASDTTNEEIATWIEKNCQPSTLRTPEFVTTVTTAIVNATVSDSGSNARFEEDSFSKRALLIKKYVHDDKELQLRVLYALQIAVTQLQHPPGLLNGIFNQIYDLEIIGEEEFRRWRDKGTESFGKGAAVTTVKNFFDWLDGGETESDNDT